MRTDDSEPTLYGVVAEFTEPEALVRAATRVREEGYRRIDAYSPFPVHGLADAIGFEDPKVPWIVFIGGVLGAIGGFALLTWVSVIEYPINVGGRPLLSWPSFIPITFECTVLLAAFGAFFGMLALNGLPRPHHPIFNTPDFERATQDRFFLCIEATDPKFDLVKTQQFLGGLGAHAVSAVAD